MEEEIDNGETVKCMICGERHKRIYGKHFNEKHPGMTAEIYRKLYNNAPIGSINTMKNMGKHMKTEKYKKMFSEKFGGENNPNSKTKTTEIERKERSPSCIEFYEKRYPDLTDEERQNMLKEHVAFKVKDRILPSHIEYWTNRGFTEKEAKKKVSESQTTFSKEKCIEKHGEEEGMKVFTERQKKWQKTLFDNGNVKNGYSKISQELFDIISERVEGEFKYATKGGEFCINIYGKVYSYDFLDIKRMKIIEYHGDQYHANPRIYNETDYPHPYRKRKGYSAKDIWKMDEDKKYVAESRNYEILYIWDSEYKKNKQDTISKCINFLNQ
jgi:hypothetical protein